MGGCFCVTSPSRPQEKTLEKQLEMLIQTAYKEEVNQEKYITEKKGVVPVNNRADIPIQSQKALLKKQKTMGSQRSSFQNLLKQSFKEKKIKEKIQTLKIYEEKNQIVIDSVEYPYSAIGFVYIETGEKQDFFGTGCIISSHRILTCAHNCYDPFKKIKYKNIYFTPSPYYPSQEKKYKAKHVHYPTKFQNADYSNTHRKNQYVFTEDYAVLELDTEDDLQKKFGSLGFDLNWGDQMEDHIIRKCTIVGYYREKEEISLHKLSGDIYVDEDCIRHTMPTIKGCSGSPIFEQVGTEYVIRGIHNNQIPSEPKHMTGVLMNTHLGHNLNLYLGNTHHYYDFNGYASGSSSLNDQRLHEFITFSKAYSPPLLTSLKKLYISNNKITSEGCISLSDSCFSNLQELILTDNNVTGDGCQKLAKIEFKQLKVLGLSGNQVRDEGCNQLQRGQWPQLQQLWLTNNKITDKGAISLKERSSHWQLTILALSTDREYEDSNKLEDIGCKYLLEGKWSALKILGLSDNLIESQGCRFIKEKASQLPQLSSLSLC